ncbi:hypothetical protein FT663_02007 [Candidozyma haemuli var. vulneris]|uniref:Mitochondrial import receptor subunit TOM22 n=1 Tax=Candidozyma haemuli TaxID=45357 RepID=A0A2V1AM83_9ASCO|nr:hypothetical protein CXQ85_001240 [[Candida] haemuloni]KAF3991861.1 hypothetical protein FT662_01478 [[Candida] haemuloni var. vulneris]KAF3993176.1 hypothetical protein FT663_02007 [[Candida] haemuloni var. vulneris]PVH18948.1 hypothetical protein CXQ85_001240 [[Candida] haemuloni]
MVKLTQVDDETAAATQEPKDVFDHHESDSDSESDFEDDDIENETLYDRIVALKDIVPPEQRVQLSQIADKVKSYTASGISTSGSLLWALTSTGLLLGFPFFIALFSEMQLQEMEKGVAMQQSSQDLIASGADPLAAEGSKEQK